MKRSGLILLLCLGMFLTACGPSQRPAFERNLSLWKSQSISHYRFNLTVGCFCPWSSLMPLTVEVRNAEIVSMVARNSADISAYQDTFRKNATIEGLFDTVNSAISKRVYQLDVQYDARYGFPSSIGLNPSKMVMDDETSYEVSNFEVLP